jgi:hypothetical protein
VFDRQETRQTNYSQKRAAPNAQGQQTAHVLIRFGNAGSTKGMKLKETQHFLGNADILI